MGLLIKLDTDQIIMKILKTLLVYISVLSAGNFSAQWTDTATDTLLVNDSLVFSFEKLTQNQIDSLKLYLIDKNGNEVYQAMKTEEGLIFNYLPSYGEYYFKIHNLPEGISKEYIEVPFMENKERKMLLANLNEKEKTYIFTRTNSSEKARANFTYS